MRDSALAGSPRAEGKYRLTLPNHGHLATELYTNFTTERVRDDFITAKLNTDLMSEDVSQVLGIVEPISLSLSLAFTSLVFLAKKEGSISNSSLRVPQSDGKV